MWHRSYDHRTMVFSVRICILVSATLGDLIGYNRLGNNVRNHLTRRQQRVRRMQVYFGSGLENRKETKLKLLASWKKTNCKRFHTCR